jgi:hypothetical protein
VRGCRFRNGVLALAVAAALPGAACGGPATDAAAGAVSTAIVYGADDRREYFEIDRAGVRDRVAHSMVALIPRRHLRPGPDGVAVTAPPLGEVEGLCEGEPFAGQPAAAFCSGVLVDWDLVLTSGHCARVLAVQDFVAAFGFYYAAPGDLALRRDDVFDVSAIVSEALDGAGARPRLDHAWLRLAGRARPPRAPVPIRASGDPVRVGDPVLFVGAGGGVPLKVDAGGSVAHAGAPWFDYFVASTDSFRGASGGGAFGDDLALVGVLGRGGPDFVTQAACKVTFREQPHAAQEEFSFAARALEALCARDPGASSLCRAGCGDPCAALPASTAEPDGGCSVAGRRGRGGWPLLLAPLALLPGRRRHPAQHRG